MEYLELHDETVLLRPYQPDDVDVLYEAAHESVPEVGRWLPWCHLDYQRQEALDWVERAIDVWRDDVEYHFVILDRESGRFAGSCGLNWIDRLSLRANLGYWVRTTAIGRGYAPAAARLVARFGFERLALERIEIITALSNVRSQRVAQKIGAVREGIARRRVRLNGTQQDAVVFSLIREDLLERQPPAGAAAGRPLTDYTGR